MPYLIVAVYFTGWALLWTLKGFLQEKYEESEPLNAFTIAAWPAVLPFFALMFVLFLVGDFLEQIGEKLARWSSK